MIVRTLAISALLFAGAVAFGGAGETDLGIADNAAATCTHVDDVGCLENVVCDPVAGAIEKVTGNPTGCIG